MASSKVNGRATSRPAGYDSFDYSKKTRIRSTQLQHGKGKEGFRTPQHAKIAIDDIFQAIYEHKVNGKPLENVVRIKAQPNKIKDQDKGKGEELSQ